MVFSPKKLEYQYDDHSRMKQKQRLVEGPNGPVIETLYFEYDQAVIELPRGMKLAPFGL